ncbi:MAG: pantetheine-phosphate adenylyltransferase [Actinomycetota bacterium]|nr:pantetheine-phosphate adenylyltransferase [Actinomycetota bacterium]
MNIAVCPGSFDPVTSGHLDIISRASRLFDRVIVGVYTNAKNDPLFTLDERLTFIRQAIEGDRTLSNVKVESFNSLLVNFARNHGASAIVKGLRAVSDFEHEFQMAQLNLKLEPKIETIFMMASTKYAYLSSSAVKEIAKFSGCVDGLVTEEVKIGLKKAFAS